jgi:hypothetical protein
MQFNKLPRLEEYAESNDVSHLIISLAHKKPRESKYLVHNTHIRTFANYTDMLDGWLIIGDPGEQVLNFICRSRGQTSPVTNQWRRRLTGGSPKSVFKFCDKVNPLVQEFRNILALFRFGQIPNQALIEWFVYTTTEELH